MYYLTVRHGFGDFKAGALITDQATVAFMLETNPNQVIRHWVEDAAPEAEPIITEEVAQTEDNNSNEVPQ